MTLQLCVSPCALKGAKTIDRHRSSTPCNTNDDALPEPPELPEDDDWDEDEFELPDDDVFFDFCEIDDAPEPQPGDYWDESLDGEWDCTEFGIRSAEFGVSARQPAPVIPHSELRIPHSP